MVVLAAVEYMFLQSRQTTEGRFVRVCVGYCEKAGCTLRGCRRLEGRSILFCRYELSYWEGESSTRV
jgi:hypothetical protein